MIFNFDLIRSNLISGGHEVDQSFLCKIELENAIKSTKNLYIENVGNKVDLYQISGP